jgi:protein-S-isoprenylcysteine O-methyltransferase Ste14
LALVLLDLVVWFVEPFSTHQIVSWLLLAASMALVLSGAWTLKARGKPNRRRVSDVPITGIERTTTLATEGVYRYVRHPIYASGVYGAWGVFFKDPSWPGAFLAVASIGFWVAAARFEEAECVRYFGEPYREYIRRTRMFVPLLF